MSTVKHDKPISKHTTMIWCPRRCSPMILGMKEFSPECKYKVRITLRCSCYCRKLCMCMVYLAQWDRWDQRKERENPNGLDLLLKATTIVYPNVATCLKYPPALILYLTLPMPYIFSHVIGIWRLYIYRQEFNIYQMNTNLSHLNFKY